MVCVLKKLPILDRWQKNASVMVPLDVLRYVKTLVEENG